VWINKSIIDWFKISQTAFDELKADNAALKTERDLLERQLQVSTIQADWYRNQINILQQERSALLEKAYNIKVPTPLLVSQPKPDPNLNDFSFEDIGDEMARKLGLPVYGSVGR
jgi:hypothetical protein